MCHLSSWGEGAHRLVLIRTIDGEQQKKNVSHKRNARTTQQVYGRILSPCLSFRLTLYPTPGTKLAGHHARVTVGAVSTSLWQRDAGVMPAWTGNYVRLLPLHSGRTSGRGKRRCRVRTVGWKRFFVEAVLGRARVTRAGRGRPSSPGSPASGLGSPGTGARAFPAAATGRSARSGLRARRVESRPAATPPLRAPQRQPWPERGLCGAPGAVRECGPGLGHVPARREAARSE